MIESSSKAVELSFARGNAKEIAEELGIRPELLYRWPSETGQNLVAKMMRAAGLQARKPKELKVTTDSKHNHPVAPNLLDQEFYAAKLVEVWVTGIFGTPSF